ncbi:hypothetical protein ACOKFD_15715 [Flagellimonas sp. S174]|uniref:hypothetical protein n=1 Tax=Flagellimonas sp. S174 TaxID=3410790 RepID=UPI003BF5EBD3
MLHELLNVKSIGAELKLIWNNWHERQIVNKYDVSYMEIENYIKADSGMLSFSSTRTRDRAIRELKRLGADEFYLADNYRDVILSQAHYYINGTFPEGYGVKTPEI